MRSVLVALLLVRLASAIAPVCDLSLLRSLGHRLETLEKEMSALNSRLWSLEKRAQAPKSAFYGLDVIDLSDDGDAELRSWMHGIDFGIVLSSGCGLLCVLCGMFSVCMYVHVTDRHEHALYIADSKGRFRMEQPSQACPFTQTAQPWTSTQTSGLAEEDEPAVNMLAKITPPDLFLITNTVFVGRHYDSSRCIFA